MIKVGKLFKELPQNRNGNYWILLYMAASFGIELCFFTEKDIDFAAGKVNGLFYIEGKKVRKLVPLPKIIDNQIVPLTGNAALFKELEKTSYIARHRLGLNKLQQYAALSEDGTFSHILIPTQTVQSPEQVKKIVADFGGTAALKPVNSMKGQGVSLVRQIQEHFEVCEGSVRHLKTADEFGLYAAQLAAKKYIIQPNIQSRTKDDQPFDIRIRAQRKSASEFVHCMYPRIGSVGGVTSNIHTGGGSMPLGPFLAANFPDEQVIIKSALSKLAAEFPPYFQKFVKDPIFDIGLDIGIIRDPLNNNEIALRMFEANAFPGASGNVGERTSLETSRAVLQYYRYIYNNYTKVDK